ncbi:ribonuclease [Chamberlinius hualienensis]
MGLSKLNILLILSVFIFIKEVTCDWDYLLLTQQWPPTVCQQWKQQNPKHECTDWKGEMTWTMHGIWPSDISGNDPAFCNASLKYNATVVQPLKPHLEIYWPNMYKGTVDDEFWAHEWNKHGTCAVTDSRLSNEFSYFNSGINLAIQFNIYKYLAQQNITPSLQELELSDIEAAIKTALGIKPLIQCYKDKEKNQHLIQEIRICLNKSLEIIECPPHVRYDLEYTQTCPDHEKLFYPPKQPSTNTEAVKYKSLLWFWCFNLPYCHMHTGYKH